MGPMAVPRPLDPVPDPDSVAALLTLAARGETAALARVIRVRHEFMTRVALVVTLDGAAAAEAVDAVWPGAWRTLQGRGVPADPEAWLARLAADEARLRAASDAPATSCTPADAPADLAALAPADRAGFALRHVAGVAPEPVARGPFASAREARARRRADRVDARVDPAAVRRWLAGFAVRPVNADATARRARDEAGLERTRRVSVAVSVVAGTLVAAAPYLVPLVFRT